ncbi:hypothetical protein LRP88_14381 [Fusarium phalaenopsidis]
MGSSDARPEGVYDTSDTGPSGSATDDSDDGTERGIARRGRQRGRGAARVVGARRREHTEKLARQQPVLHRPATSGWYGPATSGWYGPATSGWYGPQPLSMPTPTQMQAQPARPPVMAGVSPPPGPPVSHPSTGQNVYATLLTIHWIGNGKKSMAVNTVPTKQSLVRLAINETRIQSLTFADEEADYPLRSHDRPNAQTIVRRVTLGDKNFEVSAFGNDLGAFFCNPTVIPEFDVEVPAVKPPPQSSSPACPTSSRDLVD